MNILIPKGYPPAEAALDSILEHEARMASGGPDKVAPEQLRARIRKLRELKKHAVIPATAGRPKLTRAKLRVLRPR